jgi:protocatechuate 3,4-dioxygenase beta subunit
MKKYLQILFASIFVMVQTACVSMTPIPVEMILPTSTPRPTRTCKPTLNDGVSPSYIPNTPERTVVGSGHVLTGQVLSSADCMPIPNAKLEFWTEEEGLGHPDSSRATFFTDENGFYRFECNQPEHIHMRISAEGYRTIGVNSYHPEGAAEGVFDIVLEIEK